MSTESLDDCWPLNRQESRRYISENKVEKAWLTSYTENEFAIGFDLVSGGQCILVSNNEKPITFRQFEGAHKELFDLGMNEFEVNVERWNSGESYNRFKSQYEGRKKREKL